MRILLVEDDAALASAVCSYLTAKAFVVDVAPGLAEARPALLTVQYAAVLLDLHLGDGDGLSLLANVRALRDRPIVIVLTARDQVTDRIRGLDAGADDYLIKPYDPAELLARLRAVERRRSTSSTPVLRLGTLEIDLARDLVRKDGNARHTDTEGMGLAARDGHATRSHPHARQPRRRTLRVW